MRLEGEQQSCRVMLSTHLFYKHVPLYEVIVQKAWQHALAGATVMRARLGYLPGGRLLKENLWHLSNELPVALEIVDAAARLSDFLPQVHARLRRALGEAGGGGAMLTLERAKVLYYGAREKIQERVELDDPNDIVEVGAMPETQEAVMLRVFIDDGDRDPETDQPLSESLVKGAHDLGVAGAAVFRGVMGFGAHAAIHQSGFLVGSLNMPVVIEFVDAPDRIALLRPLLEAKVKEGLVTEEGLRIVRYGS